MKTLVIIRHAKSESPGFGQSDFERGLEPKGILEAEAMSLKLINKIPSIDHFISSTALRARLTCEKFSETFRQAPAKTEYADRLYHAPESVIYDVIANVHNQYNTIAVVGHNPGITAFANTLTDKITIDNMPTSGIFAVEADCNEWSEFEKAKKKFLFFDYPKNY
jgi:phosphohistidine phosphatase